jgi:hypothetical protein
MPSSRAPALPVLLFLFVALAAAAGAACKKTPPPPEPEAVRAKAQVVLAPYKASLKGELTAALAQGPEVAVEVCAARAPALAAEHSKDGVRVGRSAKKLRTPNDAPPPWLLAPMNELADAPRGEPASRVVALGDGRWGYAEAIWMQPQCLLCHGEAIAPDLDAKIRARYPDDDARGFAAGDFRGVFFAELDQRALAAR